LNVKEDINSKLREEIKLEDIDLEEYLAQVSKINEIAEYFEVGTIPVYAACKWETTGGC
jgi:hypothetical protein